MRGDWKHTYTRDREDKKDTYSTYTGALDQLSHLNFVVTFFQNKLKCLSVLVLRKPLNCSLQPHIFRPTPIILFVSINTPLVLFIKKI